MRVLLTNDDGITATGLQRACAGPCSSFRTSSLEVIAPDSNRSATGARRDPARPDLGRGDRVRRRHERLRDRRDAGGLRPLRRARPDRCAARADRVGHQPRREPRRRHHLLRHRRRGARGHRARHPAIAVSQQSGAARWTSRRDFDFALAAPFVARWSSELDDVPMPGGTLLNVNVPGWRARSGARRAGSASASTTTRWS